MQYWIFFVGGTGGDGFANLLEHADNIQPVDAKEKKWRVRSIWNSESGKVAFGRPLPFNLNPCDPYFTNYCLLEPTQIYRDLVEKNINTVISTHPHWYTQHPDCKYWQLFAKNQVKILLYSRDKFRIARDYVDKLREEPSADTWLEKLTQLSRLQPPLYWAPDLGYDVYIDIEEVWKDWNYLNQILTNIGISLDRKYYEEYLDISKRRCL